MNQTTNELNLLQDFDDEMQVQPASKGARFFTLLIDLACYYALAVIYGFIFGLALASNGGDIQDSYLFQNTGSALFLRYLISFALFLTYYTIMEGATKGRTVGKFITGTRAVREDGSAITWKDAFLRTLCRFVPFEPFSGLGVRPWHDEWTRTEVIKK
ncbi:MAG: RDD family protein [Chitinophagaceae bacterium]|nr:RDD family protein [Chitinophagaceae bacterium]